MLLLMLASKHSFKAVLSFYHFLWKTVYYLNTYTESQCILKAPIDTSTSLWFLVFGLSNTPSNIYINFTLKFQQLWYLGHHLTNPGFPCGSAGKESACNMGDLGSIPGLGRSPGEGKGYPLQYSGLENSMDCIVHGVTKSWNQLSDFLFSQIQRSYNWMRPVSQCVSSLSSWPQGWSVLTMGKGILFQLFNATDVPD